MYVGSKATVEEVRDNLIRPVLPKEAISIKLFDVFMNEEKKSLAFKIVFQSHEETLSDEWVNRVMQDVNKKLEGVGYEVR